MPSFVTESQWIAAAVDTPFMAVLAWMLHSLRDSIAQGPGPEPGDDGQHRAALERTRENLTAFKLEVARTYVPLSLIREVDGRLTGHLLRIEQKLDEATRTAHSTAAQVRVLAEDR